VIAVKGLSRYQIMDAVETPPGPCDVQTEFQTLPQTEIGKIARFRLDALLA
jgi:2-oxo-4-hydroxy-4-carboxy--5-ureidoimidazoline (OHCU) decarboxylase